MQVQNANLRKGQYDIPNWHHLLKFFYPDVTEVFQNMMVG
jgi:hypothetical protein